jgi:hypothetical protein
MTGLDRPRPLSSERRRVSCQAASGAAPLELLQRASFVYWDALYGNIASGSTYLRRKRVKHHMPKVNSEVLRRVELFEPGHYGNMETRHISGGGRRCKTQTERGAGSELLHPNRGFVSSAHVTSAHLRPS